MIRIIDAWTRRAEIDLALRVTFLVVCALIIFSEPYPPARAQSNPITAAVPVITVEDARQDERLGEANDHLKSTDGNVAKISDEVHKNSLDIAGIQGEERVIGFILGTLISISIVIQVRAKKA